MKPRSTALAAVLLVAGCSDGVDSPSGNPTPTPSPTQSPGPTATPTPSPSGCVDPLAPGDHVVECGDIDYSVRVPASCPPSGCGLVLDVHGLTMSADMEDANTGMRERGEANGFVVVQPSAPDASWDESNYDPVHSFVTEAIEALEIDTDRVHVTGFSQGGHMTFAMICRWPDTWASAAPGAAAGGDCFTGTGTPPATGMPVLQIHGTGDVLVAFSAAEAQRDGVIAAWGLGAGTQVDAGTGFARTRYEGTDGALLEFLQHDYESPVFYLQGHCYPGSEDPGNAPDQIASFACDPPNAFVYGEVVMDFFLAHPRP